MAKNINKDVVYKAAKSKEKDYMLNDGEGINLFISRVRSKTQKPIIQITLRH